MKAKKAAVLYDVASDYNKGIAEVFKADYEKLGGADLEGYYFSTHYAAADVAALTRDAFWLFFTAIKNAGKTDREAVRGALAKLPGYAGVTGDMKFQDGSGDPIKSAVILQVKGGKFVYVTNAQP